jgi:CheY-like chemotaxis protein
VEIAVKYEVLCNACGHGYLLDESTLDETGEVPCVGCGATIRVQRRKRPPRGEDRPSGPVPPPEARATGAPTRQVAATAELPEPERSPREAVVCPRCGLHFAPRKDRDVPVEETRRTVLVVEDMEYFLSIARDSLSDRYDVKTAKTVDDALSILRDGGVDLMVLDLTLDGTENGVRVLETMQPKPCPIIVFTAQDEAEMYGEKWEELMSLGADDLVLKGMNVGEVLARKVAEILGDPWGEDE